MKSALLTNVLSTILILAPQVWIGVFGLIAAVSSFRSGWKATALSSLPLMPRVQTLTETPSPEPFHIEDEQVSPLYYPCRNLMTYTSTGLSGQCITPLTYVRIRAHTLMRLARANIQSRISLRKAVNY